MTTATLETVINEAAVLAEKATDAYVNTKLGGQDAYPCGFGLIFVRF